MLMFYVIIDLLMADDFIRLTPSVPGARGWIWAELPNTYAEWEAELTFRVSGSHMHGGRGLAFWYTKEAMGDGPIFGARDNWDGLGIWLDSANPRVSRGMEREKTSGSQPP